MNSSRIKFVFFLFCGQLFELGLLKIYGFNLFIKMCMFVMVDCICMQFNIFENYCLLSRYVNVFIMSMFNKVM